MRNFFPAANILIVEDEAIIAMMLELEIERMGHKVTKIANTCRDALRSLAEHRPDLVILDYNLGTENARPIAQELCARAIPYIMCTALLSPVRQDHALKPIGVVAKPVDLGKLNRLIERALYPSVGAAAA